MADDSFLRLSSMRRGLIPRYSACCLLAVLMLLIVLSDVGEGARYSSSGSRYTYSSARYGYRSSSSRYSRYSYSRTSYRSYRSYRTYRAYRSYRYSYRYTPSRYTNTRYSYSRYSYRAPTYYRATRYYRASPSYYSSTPSTMTVPTTTTTSPSYRSYRSSYRSYRSYTYRSSYYSYRSGSLATRYNTRYTSYYNVGYRRTSRTSAQPIRYSRAYKGSRSYYYYYYNQYFYYNPSAVYLTRNTGSDFDVCSNYEANQNGTALKLFTCPLPFEPPDFTQCCGYSYAQYCCKYFDEPGVLIGTIIGGVIGAIVFVLIIVCCIKCFTAKKKGVTVQAPRVTGRTTVRINQTVSSGQTRLITGAQNPIWTTTNTYPVPAPAPPTGAARPFDQAAKSAVDPNAPPPTMAAGTQPINTNFSPFTYNEQSAWRSSYTAPPGGQTGPGYEMPELPPPAYNSLYTA